MKEFSYSYLPIGTFILAQIISLILLPCFTILFLAILQITPSLFFLITLFSFIPFIYLSKIFLKIKITTKTLTISDNGLEQDNQIIEWNRIKWYRFDHSKYGDLEKIVMRLTNGDKYKIKYYDTRSNRQNWKDLKKEVKIAIDANCENLTSYETSERNGDLIIMLLLVSWILLPIFLLGVFKLNSPYVITIFLAYMGIGGIIIYRIIHKRKKSFQIIK
ncbi:MAG: hypothetical protein ACERIH_04285 [Labilibaculum antarcticum]